MANKPMFGNTEVSNFMAGDTQVDKVMVGSELLWEISTGLGCDPFGDGSGLLYDKLDNALVNECGGDIAGEWFSGDSYCSNGLRGACACDFLSATTYIDYPLNTSPANWSVSIWFYVTSDGDSSTIYALKVGTYRLRFIGTSCVFQNLGDYEFDIEFDTWYHVVTTYDDYEIKMEHYVNSVKVDTYGINHTINNLFIGGYTDSDQLFMGAVDEVRLFDRVLTLDEIQILYYDGVR